MCVGRNLQRLMVTCAEQSKRRESHTRLSQNLISAKYARGDEKAFWRRIKRHRILPKDDPMTHELNRMMEQASSKLHSNLQSVAGHIEEDFEFQEPRVEITVKFLINELNPGIESIWGVCSYILTEMYHMARLFAES